MNKRSQSLRGSRAAHGHSPRSLSTSDPSAAACSAHTRLKTPVARRSGKSSVSWKQEPPDRNCCSPLTHIHAVTRPPPDVIRFSCVCVCDVTEVTSRKSCTIGTPLPPHKRRNGSDSACLRLQRQCGAARRSCRGGFRKTVFDPSFVQGRIGACARNEGKNLFPKIASPVAPRRFGPSQKSDPGALGIGTCEIHGRAARICIGRDASNAHGGACAGASASRPASVKAPVAGVDKLAHPENSGFPMRMWLRSWL